MASVSKILDYFVTAVTVLTPGDNDEIFELNGAGVSRRIVSS